MAQVECEDLTADEFAVLAAIVEINETGGVFGCPVPKNEITRDRRQERGQVFGQRWFRGISAALIRVATAHKNVAPNRA
jgi:hypothetical protein